MSLLLTLTVMLHHKGLPVIAPWTYFNVQSSMFYPKSFHFYWSHKHISKYNNKSQKEAVKPLDIFAHVHFYNLSIFVFQILRSKQQIQCLYRCNTTIDFPLLVFVKFAKVLQIKKHLAWVKFYPVKYYRQNLT